MLEAELTLIASPWIRHAHADGLLVILNLHTESYLVLDFVSTAMWSALIGETKWDDARQMLLDHYDVAPAVLDADLLSFAERCCASELLVADRGNSLWVEHAVQKPPSKALRLAIPIPAVLRAVWTLYDTHHYLNRNGFRYTYELYGRIPAGIPEVSLDVMLARFCWAEHFFVGRRAPGDCLLRSLSLFRYLKEDGFSVEHVIGVSRVPFLAHAWVECDGEPLLEECSPKPHYSSLSRMRGGDRVYDQSR
jgi:hypothetical protein